MFIRSSSYHLVVRPWIVSCWFPKPVPLFFRNPTTSVSETRNNLFGLPILMYTEWIRIFSQYMAYRFYCFLDYMEAMNPLLVFGLCPKLVSNHNSCGQGVQASVTEMVGDVNRRSAGHFDGR